MTTTRRKFLAGAGAGAVGASLATPAIAQSTITWRMQTYAGAALAEHVVKPAIDKFNLIAGDEMQIELFYGDQLVPTGAAAGRLPTQDYDEQRGGRRR